VNVYMISKKIYRIVIRAVILSYIIRYLLIATIFAHRLCFILGLICQVEQDPGELMGPCAFAYPG